MDDLLEKVDPEEKPLRVLDYELKSLKKGRKLYLQQPGSNVFFLCKKVEAVNHLEKEREMLSERQKQKKRVQKNTLTINDLHCSF
ncbi:ASNSD1 upstream open reading frame protein-like [Procambarus clarkii]|uniref:ASNSD1 upstream open reading frame protein-like n=1 Tax=Procambarus clarkii TaxID=6728 RepID=UPI003743C199